MKYYFNKILSFFNVSDKSNNLSITNVAVIVCLIKIAITTQCSFAEGIVFLVAILNYVHKRYSVAKSIAQEIKQVDYQEFQERLNSLDSKLNQYCETHAEIIKQAVETKKLVSNSNLAQAFVPRNRRE